MLWHFTLPTVSGEDNSGSSCKMWTCVDLEETVISSYVLVVLKLAVQHEPWSSHIYIVIQTGLLFNKHCFWLLHAEAGAQLDDASVWIRHFLFYFVEALSWETSQPLSVSVLFLLSLSPHSVPPVLITLICIAPYWLPFPCAGLYPFPSVHPPTLYLYSKGSQGSLASVPVVLFKHLPRPVPRCWICLPALEHVC